MGVPIIQQPYRVPLVDQGGLITREWARYFAALYSRGGGASGASADDLSASAFEDAGIAEQGAALAALGDAAGQMPTVVVHTLDPEAAAELSALREQVADLQRQINDIQQGVAT